MLIRWVVLKLCATRVELRLVLRTVQAVLRREPGEEPGVVIRDRRLTRTFRLAFLLAMLIVYIERPQLFGMAVLLTPLVCLLLITGIAGLFR